MPVAIYRLLGQPGATTFATAMALATILLGAHGARHAPGRPRARARRGRALTAEAPRPLLEIAGLHVAYGRREVLRGVDLAVPEAGLVCVLGPSGSGKTTLLRAIAGLETPTAGTMTMDGRDLLTVPPHERGFGLMFQDYALFPHRDVAGNVAFGLRMAGLPDPAIRARVAEVLALVGLEGLESRRVEQLSGGEQQRVALARALAPRPRLLMLDEPMGSLDRALRERLPEELRDLFRSLGLAALYVTHDQDEALSVADWVVILDAGLVVAEGTPERLWSRPPTRGSPDSSGSGTSPTPCSSRTGRSPPRGAASRPRARRTTPPGP